MNRTVASGWGASPVGAWRVVEGASSVGNGQAMLASRKPGITARATVAGVTAADVSSRYTVTVPALPVGGPLYLAQAVRIVGKDSYGVRLRVHPDGSAYVSVVRMTDLTTVQNLSERRLPFPVTTGMSLRVALDVTGTSPVTLAAKAWAADGDEPSAWQVTHADSSATRITAAGGYGFALYTSSGAKAAVPLAIDDVLAAAPAPVATPTPTPTPTPAPRRTRLLRRTRFRFPGDADHPGDTRSTCHPGRCPREAGRRRPGVAVVPGTRHRDLRGAGRIGRRCRYEELAGAHDRGRAAAGTERRHHRAPRWHLPRGDRRAAAEARHDPARSERGGLDGRREDRHRLEARRQDLDGRRLGTALDSSPTYTKGAPDNTQPEWRFVDPAHPMAAHPDQVWVAGVQLREVASAAQVVAGTFFVDDRAKRLVIGTDPTGKPVEASVLTQALSIRSAGSEVRGIGIRRYATSVPQMGTVIAAASDITLADVTIRDNSTTGFYSWAPRTTLTRVSLIGNGLLGGGASQADGLKVKQMLSVGNNAERFNHSPVSGAFKVTRTRGVTVTDSAFTGNAGRGPWFDESVIDIVFTGNDVIGNTGHGVMVELSERAVVADNIIARNGDFGLFVLNSGNVKIWNNTFVGNANRNVSIGQDGRRASDPNAAGHDPRTRFAPLAPWIVRNTVMSNNVMAESAGNCLVCVQDYSTTFTGAQMMSSVTATSTTAPPPARPDGSRPGRRDPSRGIRRWQTPSRRSPRRRVRTAARSSCREPPWCPPRTCWRPRRRSVRPQWRSPCRRISPRYRDSPATARRWEPCRGDDLGMGSLLAVGARALTMVIALVCGVLTTRMIIGDAGVGSFALYTLLTTIRRC